MGEGAVWTEGWAQYLRRVGVNDPTGICLDVSPAQLGMMSQREKDRWWKGRTADFERYRDARVVWEQLVMASYDASQFTLDLADVHPDVRKLVRERLRQRQEQAWLEQLRVGREQNYIWDIGEELWVGAVVWSIVVRRYVTLTKVNRVTARYEWQPGKVITGKVGEFRWLSDVDLEQAVREGRPIAKERPA